MKKILLIEDRAIRQQFFINETKINLDNYSAILENCIKESYSELEIQLEKGTFNFDEYDYIISHKSAFGKNNAQILEKLKNYCKLQQKPLIFFSGGIATNYYDTVEFELLEINSKTFYSENLELFLEATQHDNENILMLCYGKDWKTNIVLNTIENLNIFLESNSDEDIDYAELKTAIDIEKLVNIINEFYTIKTEDGWVFLSEIIKFKDSLYRYIDSLTLQQEGTSVENQTSILIHNDNIFNLTYFDTRIKFKPNLSNIDKYISKIIIPELEKKDFDVLYIKDNLSENYMELYGIRLAYHVRLSQELGNKRFIPIIIISDFNVETLIRQGSLSNILVTKNIYLVQNNKASIESIEKSNLINLTPDEYENEFLNKIVVEQPKDYLTHHDIANEWSIHTWAEFLKVKDSDAISKNTEKVSSMLYFKYLIANYPVQTTSSITFAPKKPQSAGTVLYIDDQWKEGWSDIFDKYYSKTPNINFNTFEYQYKDMNKFEFLKELSIYIELNTPDMVLLDLRLTKNDHNEMDTDNLTGVKILNIIKNINQGIQVVMFTATTQSRILEKLYDSGILGYIQKEHPKGSQLDMRETFLKLKSLTDNALDRSYLKEIWNLQEKILKLPFLSNEGDSDKINELQENIKTIFETANSNMPRPFTYTMFAIYKCIELLNHIYIIDDFKNAKWIDTENPIDNAEDNSTKNYMLNIIKYKTSLEKINFEDKLREIVCSRNYAIHTKIKPSCRGITREEPSSKNSSEYYSKYILEWYRMLFEILNSIIKK